MGSIEVFDRQLRLGWWGQEGQEKLRRTSLFIIADNPYAYIGAITAAAIGFGNIYLVGSRHVKNFRILFEDFSGDFSRGTVRFVEKYLGRFLDDYSMRLESISINLASNSALRLVKNIIDTDESENKVILDLSTDLQVKLFVWKLMGLTGAITYMAIFSEGVKLYALSDIVRGSTKRISSRKKPTWIARDMYARIQKQKTSRIPIEHLFLLASGLLLGEVALRIQGKFVVEGSETTKNFVPTAEIEFPFEELPQLRSSPLTIRSIVVVGAGALGTFYAIQLATMINLGLLRVKEIIFVDPDTIELTNFNRQVMYWGDTIGMPKAEVMAERFQKMVYGELIVKDEEARFEEIEDRLKNVSLIVEGVDTWAARKEIARFAVKHRRPLISAGVSLLHGQETFYLPFRTYCPFHSMNLEEKEDPKVDESCLNIPPSVIFTNITLSSAAILTSIGAKYPLNGVLYYSLEGFYEKYRRFHVEKYQGSCGD